MKNWYYTVFVRPGKTTHVPGSTVFFGTQKENIEHIQSIINKFKILGNQRVYNSAFDENQNMSKTMTMIKDTFRYYRLDAKGEKIELENLNKLVFK